MLIIFCVVKLFSDRELALIIIITNIGLKVPDICLYTSPFFPSIFCVSTRNEVTIGYGLDDTEFEFRREQRFSLPRIVQIDSKSHHSLPFIGQYYGYIPESKADRL
jgi:hypothetical protein